MNVVRTGWDGQQLLLHGGDASIPIEPGMDVDWTVGATQTAPDVPSYVFEPRNVEAVDHALEEATTEVARRALQAELDLCNQPHVVYIAWYGTLPKVGMTSEARLTARLQEQGADAGQILHRAAERAEARNVERNVAFQFRLPEWRTSKELLPQFSRPVPTDRIAARAEALAKRLAPTYRLEDLEWLEHPLPVLDAPPFRAHAPGVHRGKVVGAKGTFLVYRPTDASRRLAVGKAPYAALKHTDLQGRTLTVGAT